MKEQISLFDVVDSQKDKLTMSPEVWDCMQSCANFTDDLGNGEKDTFLDGSPRCCAQLHHGYGTSGNEWICKVIDNVWHTWCVLYKPKEKK